MYHVIIGHNYEIVKNCALIDWGWSMKDRSKGIFKNLADEEVKYSSIRHPEYLQGLPRETKLYLVEYGALQSDLDRLSQFVAGRFQVMRNEGKQ